MKREIKFRGTTKEGVVIYGDLLTDAYKRYILPFKTLTFDEFEEVLPESIGQYTGLKDKNGIEIYENDIVKNHPYYTGEAVIRYSNFHSSFGFATDEDEDDVCLDKYICSLIEVIGNTNE